MFIEPYTLWTFSLLLIGLILMFFEHSYRSYIGMAIFFSSLGVVGNIWYAGDWWYPTSSFGFIFLEDFLYGGSYGMVSLWVIRQVLGYREEISGKSFLITLSSMVIFWLICISFLNSFYTTFLCIPVYLFICIFLFSIKIRHMIFLGIVMLTINIPLYWFVSLVIPGWIDQYYIDSLRLLGIPLYELGWHMIGGSTCYVAYKLMTLDKKKYVNYVDNLISYT